MTKSGDDKVVTIKKYANRRLYNTATSSYVTLDHLCQMVKDGQDFVVYDAKTGEDITRSVLTQIIFEEEAKGQNLLPINFMRQLISYYGDSLEQLVPSYLEFSMENFARNQEEIRNRVSEAFGDMFGIKQFEEMGRQNMQMFQRALSMFNPFTAASQSGFGATPEPTRQKGDEIADLKTQLDDLQKQLDGLAKKTTTDS